MLLEDKKMRPRSLLLRLAALAALCVCTAAWSQSAQPSAAPAAPSAPPTKEQTDAQASYLIGPGDTIQIFVWREQGLSTTIPVRPDGKITTPLVEDMVAVGKTPSQLARDIEKVLTRYIKSPQVNVLVSQPLSTFSQIQVIGQVARPQSLSYRQGMKVLDAVLAAGGLAPYAAGNRAKLIRKQADGKQQETRVRLADLLDKGDLKQNLELKPGDVLVVPESVF
jgi:polysaccharide export outer membrane protein